MIQDRVARDMTSNDKVENTPECSEISESCNSACSKEKFQLYFQQELCHLRSQIISLEETSLLGVAKQDSVDHVLFGITRLSNDVADANNYITGYDKRVYSQAVKELEDKLRATRERITPKSKFQFKNRITNNSKIPVGDTTKTVVERILPKYNENTKDSSTNKSSLDMPHNEARCVDHQPSYSKDSNEIARKNGGRTRNPSLSDVTCIEISNHQGLHIVHPLTSSHSMSFSITRLSGCIVDLSCSVAGKTSTASLVLKDIQNSLVIAGQVASATHITAVVESVIVVLSRQIRMHDCSNVKIYLHCSSRPIIENCSKIQFSPLPKYYMTDSQSSIHNQCDQVDDFNWLKPEPSPNWSKLPEEERLDDKVWTEIVSAAPPGIGVADILREIGLREP